MPLVGGVLTQCVPREASAEYDRRHVRDGRWRHYGVTWLQATCGVSDPDVNKPERNATLRSSSSDGDAQENI